MSFFVRYFIAAFITALPTLTHAASFHGMCVLLGNWELACDNTGTCRAAGYHSNAPNELAFSVLLSRKAGPKEQISGKFRIGQHEIRSKLKDFPPLFPLSLLIDDQVAGEVTLNKEIQIADFTEQQVMMILKALVERRSITLRTGEYYWRLSNIGAKQILSEMDKFQGRIDTPGALVQKGQLSEESVPAPTPPPTVIAAALHQPSPGDDQFDSIHSQALRTALRSTVSADDCRDLVDANTYWIKHTVTRLTADKMLVAARCWTGASAFGIGYWVINETPPYDPVLVTTSASEMIGEVNGKTIHSTPLGNTRSGCTTKHEWTWDGRRFVHTSASSPGMRMNDVASGGAWSLPILVSEVRSPSHD